LVNLHSDNYEVIVDASWAQFNDFIAAKSYSKIVVLLDENTKRHCYDIIKLEFPHIIIEVLAGENQKQIDSCKIIWEQLLSKHCDRGSLLINLGGGVIGDMGGFCASTYMRGIDFIQVPTTLLSQIDASVGGKLGVDLQGVKNIVGLFKNPILVWVQTAFLTTLPKRELRSGFAELVKHALILDKNLWEEIVKLSTLDEVIDWKDWVSRSIEIKNKIVLQDPFESGLRKILNFGHSVGHGIETLLLDGSAPLLHGEAVAYGMLIEAKISQNKGQLSKESYLSIKNFITKIYGTFDSSQINREDLLQVIKKDKKNKGGVIYMALIDQIGHCLEAVKVSPDEILRALQEV